MIATEVSRPHYNFFPYSFDLIVHSLKQMLWLQLMETEIFRYVNSIQWKLLVFTFLLTNNETSMCIQCWRLEHHTETVAEKDSCFGVWNVSNVVWICFGGGASSFWNWLICEILSKSFRRRRGAINAKQLNYLEQYKPSKLLKEKGSANCCIQ